jgi:amino acid permease
MNRDMSLSHNNFAVAAATPDETTSLLVSGATRPSGHASNLQTALNVMKTCMGTGVLALSFACQQGGWILFSTGLLVVAAWNVYATQRLCQCLHYMPTDEDEKRSAPVETTDTAEDSQLMPPRGTVMLGRVAWYAYGTAGLLILDVMMFLLLIGIVTAYIAATISFLSDTPFSFGSIVDASTTAMIMAVLSLVPDMGSLAHASALGLGILMTSFVVIAGYGFAEASKVSSLPVLPQGLSGISNWFGIAVYSYGVAPLTYNFRSSMSKPEDLVRVTSYALFTTTVIYTIMGAGMLSLFPDLTGDLLHELPAAGLLPTMTRLAMVCVCIMTAPLLIVPCAELIEGKFQIPYQLRTIVRFSIVALSTLLAISFPGFVQVLSFVGCFSVGAVGFCLPPLFHLKLSTRGTAYAQGHVTARIVDSVMLTSGVIATVISSSHVFKSIAHGK